MDRLQIFITQNAYANSVFLTIFLILLYFMMRKILVRRIEKNKDLTSAERTITIRKIKDYSRLLLIVLIFFLWFAKLQTVFISLLAVAAAIVVALKEIIMCVTGGMLIRFNHYFKVGDRIEVDGVRGFVTDRSITATKVLEIGPEKYSQQTTGNIISIPNSVFLSKALTNESYFQNFSIKSFTFTPPDNLSIDDVENALLSIGQEVCESYLEKAKESISKYCKKEGITLPSVEPRVKFMMSDSGAIKLLLKIPVNNKEISDIEQSLIKKYLMATKEMSKV